MDTIAAISTPLAVGGIAMIRVSGEEAICIAKRIFVPCQGNLQEKKGYTAAFGMIYDRQHRFLDEGVAIIYRSPKSFTGENVVEICCHGGILIAQKVLRALLESGARPAEAGEFSKRAYLNHKMDLTKAEGMMNLIYAQTEYALQAAKDCMNGSVYQRAEQTASTLTSLAAKIQVFLDYPDESEDFLSLPEIKKEIATEQHRLKQMLDSYDEGKVFKEGIKTALVGKPNVGKSTLMNLLSGYEKSIVTSAAGTTRDIVEEQIHLGEVTLQICDTAGIRKTEDLAEAMGVKRAQEMIKRAFLVLWVIDGSRALSSEDEDLFSLLKSRAERVVVLVHKSDLPLVADLSGIKAQFSSIQFTSQKDLESFQKMKDSILRKVHYYQPDSSVPILANERQRNCIYQAVCSLEEALCAPTLDVLEFSLEEAAQALLSLSGKAIREEVIDEIFSKFCVGK